MRTLSEEDVTAIADAVNREEKHFCRFSEIDAGDLKESVEFYKHFNEIMAESGTTLRKTVIVLGIGGLATILGLGIVAQVKKLLP